MTQSLSERLRELIARQANDDGLWFRAESAPEAYLQQELRRLHDAFEITADEIDRLALECSDLLGELDRIKRKFAKANAEIARKDAALKPFADYCPKLSYGLARGMVITQGSSLAKRQLTIGDCYDALAALKPAKGDGE